MGLRTFFLYQNQCYASFNTGWTCFNSNFDTIDCGGPTQYNTTSNSFWFENPEVAYHVYTGWQIGAGMLGLGVATFAKVLDLLCNLVLPTPSITRNRDEQWEYEKLAIEKEKEQEANEVDEEQAVDVES